MLKQRWDFWKIFGQKSRNGQNWPGLGSGIWFIRDFMRYTVFLKAVLKLHFKLFFGWQKRSIRNLLSASAIFAWNFCLQKS